ncbi:hypothetical protein Tcan_07804 [Toxocara canis]|uniref:Uncharacterized protein n=1 Tax=Toxocara canis TaxID=6265 RepID=A0A0B2VZJ6_TOXCA|nr:hypothetical protein Tcan_07804 [Toxocara canis]
MTKETIFVDKKQTPSRLGIRRGEAAKYISESARMLRSLRRHTKIPLPLPVDDDSFIFRATRRPLQSHPH